jgi:hypothetical protein
MFNLTVERCLFPTPVGLLGALFDAAYLDAPISPTSGHMTRLEKRLMTPARTMTRTKGSGDGNDGSNDGGDSDGEETDQGFS